MRVYAVLLGIALTTGYGYAAQVAITSVSGERTSKTTASRQPAAADALDTIWYGGVLDPIVVEARGGPSAGTVLAKAPLQEGRTVRCGQTSRRGYHAAL